MPRQKRALVIRWGAIGDVVWASSIFPALKDQGYHITVDVSEVGEAVLRHDPHVDHVLVTPRGSIPMDRVGEYLGFRANGYDRVINLIDTCEGVLLKRDGSWDFHWPDAVRRKVCDFNYVEFLHMVADLPYTEPRHRFYPTEAERRFGAGTAADHGPALVMWIMRGSTLHKIYPHTPSAISRLMRRAPQANVLLVGDVDDRPMADQVVDQVNAYLGDQSTRLHLMVGSHGIRDVFAVAQHCQAIVGPETCVMSAMAMEPMRKVVMLSHSTVTNLTRDWVNTVSVLPNRENAPCYPCHRLHGGDAPHCPKTKSEPPLAICADSIRHEWVIDPVIEALNKA